MSNGGDKGHHQEKKERKEPQAPAGKRTSGQVKRPTSGK
jgi:hypothetical protein